MWVYRAIRAVWVKVMAQEVKSPLSAVQEEVFRGLDHVRSLVGPGKANVSDDVLHKVLAHIKTFANYGFIVPLVVLWKQTAKQPGEERSRLNFFQLELVHAAIAEAIYEIANRQWDEIARDLRSEIPDDFQAAIDALAALEYMNWTPGPLRGGLGEPKGAPTIDWQADISPLWQLESPAVSSRSHIERCQEAVEALKSHPEPLPLIHGHSAVRRWFARQQLERESIALFSEPMSMSKARVTAIVGLEYLRDQGQEDHIRERAGSVLHEDVYGSPEGIVSKLEESGDVEEMISARHTTMGEYRHRVIEMVGRTRDPRAVEPLLDVVHEAIVSNERKTVEKVARTLRAIGPAATTPLASGLMSPTTLVRWLAADVLADIGTAEAIPALTSALNDPDEGVREAVSVALERIESR